MTTRQSAEGQSGLPGFLCVRCGVRVPTDQWEGHFRQEHGRAPETADHEG